MNLEPIDGKPNPSRRDFLVQAAKIAGLAMAGIPAMATAANHFASPVSTPPQTEGPFYPIRDQDDKDTDMTRLLGRSEQAQGEIVELQGVVLDAELGEPLEGAMVEFWQACATGKYNHPEDPNPAALDPNFQYWSQVITDRSGQFGVRTIKPGAYPATDQWTRPPHIHVKIHRRGYPSLTTQLYFEGEQLNETDEILKRVPSDRRDLVIVKFKKELDSGGNEVQKGFWTIRIAKRASIVETPLRKVFSTPELD